MRPRIAAGCSVLGFIALSCSISAIAMVKEDVEVSASAGACEQQRDAASSIAVERVARRSYPQLAENVGRINRDAVVLRATRSRGRSACVFSIEINDVALERALAASPPSYSGVAIAGLLRYVRGGVPVAGTTAEAEKATRIFLDLIDRHGGHPISLPSLHEQFRDLTFNRVGLCPVVDGATDFSSPACRVTLQYSDAVMSVIEAVRELAPQAQTFNSPELGQLDRCGGLIAVGELAADVSSSARRTLNVSIRLSAVDYRLKTQVLSFEETYPGLIQESAGGQAGIEELLVVDAITAAVNGLAQKVARSGHYSKCGRT